MAVPLAVLIVSGAAVTAVSHSDSFVVIGSYLSDGFAIRYCVHVNVTGDYPYSSDSYLFVYSNGTASYQYNYSHQYGSSSSNWSTQLTDGQVSDLFDVLMYEEFMTLEDTYEDLGWTDASLGHLERACIETGGTMKTVSFHGHSIIGIIPGSFAMLSNLVSVVKQGLGEIRDADLEITVSEPSDGGPIANITANLTNNCGVTLTDTGLCNLSWPIFIVSVNGTTVDDAQKYMIPYCLMEFPPGTTREFGPWGWNRTGLAPGTYVIMSRACVWDFIVGNISANASWIPVDDGRDADDDTQSAILYYAFAAVGVGAAAGLVALYVFRLRKAGVT
ncbi:MAG: hypothetical protein MUC90_07205 [Thermoplasmata archaeon]|nr:hypothetical protein [Thermoplasmata archaeon]